LQPQQYHKEAIDVMGWIEWIDLRDRMEDLESRAEFFIVVEIVVEWPKLD
jgi:hypothetical protein